MSELRTKLHRHSSTERFACVLCGVNYRQPPVAVGLFAADEELGDICPVCLTAGPVGAAARARVHADRLRDAADALAKLAGAIDRIGDWQSIDELRQVETDAAAEFIAVLTAAELHHLDEGYPGAHDAEYDERLLRALKS